MARPNIEVCALRKSVIGGLIALLVVLTLPLARVVAQGVQAKIDSPLPNTQVRGRVQVKGSATHPQFDFYKVEFGPGESPQDNQMSIIGAIHKEQLMNDLLETWDTTAIPDGTYTLRLRVVDKTGNYQEFWVRRLSVANTAPPDTPTPTATTAPSAPTATPTIIPPTPTIVVEQPFLQSATPLPTPPPIATPIPATTPTTVAAAVSTPSVEPTEAPALSLSTLVDPGKLGSAVCYGAVFMAFVFVFFGALSGLRRMLLYLLRRR
jgi:hypothetical protein